MQSGGRLVLYLRLNQRASNLCSELLGKPFEGKSWAAVLAQRAAGSGGSVCTIAGKRHVVLRSTIKHARAHHDATAGVISLPQIQAMYHGNEGFTIQHDGTSILLTLKWREVLAFADQLLIFGPSTNSTRRYNRCFRDRGAGYVDRVYKNLARETLGDVRQSSALLVAYLERVVVLRDNEIVDVHNHDDDLGFYETVNGERFFRVFDSMCRRRLLAAICGFNDYNKPIVDLLTIDDYVATAALVFPKLWKYLCSLRGVNQHRLKEEEEKNVPRR